MPFANKASKQAQEWLTARSGQVLLISGAKGAGKRALAAEIAQSLLCESPIEAQACGQCAACRYFLAGNHPDYFVLSPNAGDKNIKVAAVREQLVSDTFLQPQIGLAKVYIIEADYLNEQGQNALLKTLEEPPAYAYFILTVAAEEKLLPTVRSRVVPLRLMPLTTVEMHSALLKSGHDVDLARAGMLSALTGGSPGQAVELLESPWFMSLRSDLWLHFQNWPLQPRYLLLIEEFNFLNGEKDHYTEILQLLHAFLRDLLALKKGADPKSLVNQDFTAELLAFHRKSFYDAAGLQSLLDEVAKMSHGQEVNENFEMAVCNLLLLFEKLHLA